MSEFIVSHPNLKKVFFHELGHYIADALNEKHFGGASTELISFETEIRGEENHHRIQYLGKQVSEDANSLNWNHESNSIETAPYKIASTLYGCVFQYIYNPSSDVDNCYKGNGIGDAARIKQCADKFIDWSIRTDRLKSIYALADQHAKHINKITIREQVLQWDLSKVLIQRNSIYHLEVDLSYLETLAKPIINGIEVDYLEFVNNIKDIIASN